MLERQHRWPEAADAYGSALAIEERNKWLVRLGKVLERSSRDEAREVYEKLLERDPKTTDLDRRLLKADSKRFPSRRRYVRFVGRHLDDIRARAAAFRFDPPTGPPRIWMYWAQGIETAHVPAMLIGRVQTSASFIAIGSSVFSPLRKATLGEVGVKPAPEPRRAHLWLGHARRPAVG